MNQSLLIVRRDQRTLLAAITLDEVDCVSNTFACESSFPYAVEPGGCVTSKDCMQEEDVSEYLRPSYALTFHTREFFFGSGRENMLWESKLT